MVDPYAIVRRLTGHELISPKDARLLTEAVDGLIGEIGSKDARIAELEAENERLRNMLNGYGKLDAELAIAERRIEALSRTGAVKVGPLTHVIAEMLERAGEPRPNGDILHDILVQVLPAALEPAAPEGQQDDEPVVWGVFYRGKIVAVSLNEGYRYTVPLYTRPTEWAVTEAMIMVASDQISEGLGAYLRKFADSDAAKQARYWLHKMPDAEWNGMARLLAEEALGAALKAAMEAGR